MKKENLLFLGAACALAATSSLCSKGKNDDADFCLINRTVAGTVVERAGTVIHFEQYGRYSIRLDSLIINNIDNTYQGLVCFLPDDLKRPGTRVTVTGVLKNFNANENIRPILGGQELFYLEISSIKKSE
jgi:hypothetical protein